MMMLQWVISSSGGDGEEAATATATQSQGVSVDTCTMRTNWGGEVLNIMFRLIWIYAELGRCKTLLTWMRMDGWMQLHWLWRALTVLPTIALLLLLHASSDTLGYVTAVRVRSDRNGRTLNMCCGMLDDEMWGTAMKVSSSHRYVSWEGYRDSRGAAGRFEAGEMTIFVILRVLELVQHPWNGNVTAFITICHFGEGPEVLFVVFD